jgi:hypothetical protein
MSYFFLVRQLLALVGTASLIVSGFGKVLKLFLRVASIAGLNIEVRLIPDLLLAVAPDELLFDLRLDYWSLMPRSLIDLQFLFHRMSFRPLSRFTALLCRCLRLESRAVSRWDIFPIEVLARLLISNFLLRVSVLVPTSNAGVLHRVHR